MKIAVLGGTGFIGKSAILHLARQGHAITAVVRREGSAYELPCQSVVWDPAKGSSADLAQIFKQVDVVVNLAGESIADSRWSAKVKDQIRSSRILLTRKIVEAIALLSKEERPAALISGSAIGFYGNRGDEILNEDSTAGNGFLAKVCQDWEHEATQAEALGVRVVILRTGIVLGHGGGALQKMQPVVLGNGLQWMSWIHLEDMARFIQFAIVHEKVRGAYNLTAPNPVRNRDFTIALAKARGFPFVVSVPRFLLNAVLGEMAESLLASSQCLPERVIEEGFSFSFVTIERALKQIYPFKDSLEQRVLVEQFVPKPIEEVFNFFSYAENLETITPPWLNFNIVRKSTSDINEGTLIDYRLKIHGIPVRWQSKIERWIPNVEFVDTQMKGPYTKWHHTHRFEEVPHGTLVRDDIIYKVPGGIFGKWLLGAFIGRDVKRIFDYRKKKIAEVFKS